MKYEMKCFRGRLVGHNIQEVSSRSVSSRDSQPANKAACTCTVQLVPLVQAGALVTDTLRACHSSTEPGLGSPNQWGVVNIVIPCMLRLPGPSSLPSTSYSRVMLTASLFVPDSIGSSWRHPCLFTALARSMKI